MKNKTAHKTYMPLALVFLILAMTLFFSCKQKKVPIIDYSSLSEQDKRKPENALASMEVAEGLQLQLFASEPMVMNPTNMAIDAKGRIWICEGRNYRMEHNPNNSYDEKGDRILILEDTDGDGIADTSKVFYQGEDINAALGITVLGNKIIVSASPNVIVFTDEDGDDIPDSKEILFSGMEGVNHDHGVHAFVFGPDGRLYFNFGNNGAQLMDKEGNLVKDVHGIAIQNTGEPYRQGMAFRTEMDGSNVEVLGHNFRNPFELTVDSYGGIWQSDNDDDGNQSARINYIMESGNYGYSDALTGSSWQKRRTGWHNEIPKRHWHLNDPGTVPNLLQTGSGSPCGILVYEDNLLPEIYHNQLIHAEPGHNVVRSYIVSEKGSAYEASIQNMVTSKDDWFRPDDVTVAPDGSLFISDWYDGGVGGHKASDIDQGRIYHLSTTDGYKPTKFDLTTAEGASKGLLSGNMDVFYQAWNYLHAMGEAAEPFLEKLIAKGGTAKARALWLGAKIPSKKDAYIKLALTDENGNYRMQGIRMAKYVAPENLENYLASVANDSSAKVRREAAIALKHLGTPKAAEIWTTLATYHTAGDRWSLEALGIGADQHPDFYFKAWKTKIGKDWKSAQGMDIVWRVRAKATVPLLIEMIKDNNISELKLPFYFRAFDFKEHVKKNEMLLSLLSIKHPLSAQIKAYTVGQLDEAFVNSSPRNLQLVKKILPKIEGTPQWLMSIKKLKIKDQNKGLFRVVLKGEDKDIRKEAAALLFAFGGSSYIADLLSSNASEVTKMEVLEMLSGISNPTAIDFFVKCILDKKLSHPLTRKVVEVLGNSSEGQHTLYALLKEGKLPTAYKTTAVLKLMNSWDVEIKTNAPKYLDSAGNGNLDIDALVEVSGDAEQGKVIYNTYCASCHVAGDSGIEFGPTLSDIGNKLSKQFLYSNIIYPSAGINFGFEGYTLKLKDGKTYTGYILSRSEDKLTLKMMGATQKEIALIDIVEMEAMDKSLMTEGLDRVMKEQDLVDLVAYLETLKVD